MKFLVNTEDALLTIDCTNFSGSKEKDFNAKVINKIKKTKN